MTIMDLHRAAAAHGYALVPVDLHDELLNAVIEAEEMRCDLELLGATLVDDAIAAGLGAR